MAGILLPEPKQQFFDDIGAPLFAGKIFTYEAGTLTPKATYQDQELTIANTNPVIANARGEVVMYGDGNYRVILKNLFDVTIYDRDNISVYDFSAPTGSNMIGNGGETVAQSFNALQLADYGALRAYSGPRKSVYVTGYKASASPSGIAGWFVADPNDTSSIDNDGTTIVASNGMRWKRQFDGACNIQWWGAKCDGTTDDKAAIQSAHDYIVSTGKQGVLAMPAGVVCKCNSGLTLNVSFVRFDGQSSQLDFSAMGPGIAITVTGKGTGTPYSQAVSGLANVDILGPGGSSLVTDALHFTTIAEAGTAQIMVEAVVVHGFHVGHTLINNAYCINFYGCAIYNCGTCTTQPAGATNAGERITYSGCTLFNSGEGVDMQNSTGEYHFINCSFDYNAGHFYVNGGAIVLTDCHVEGNSYLQPPIRVGSANGSTLSWKGGELLCTGSNTVPMVLCQVAALKGGGAFIDGVFQHNLGSSVYFATGTGLVKNENVKTYDTSILPTLVSDSFSLFIDGSFEDATLPDVFITQDTVAITSRLTGTDIILSSSATSPRTGAKSLKAAKAFGGGSAAAFIAVAPLKIGENYTGVRGWYAKTGAQTGNMFITHLFLALRDDKATPAILRSASGGQRTFTFSAATVPYTEFLISFESGRAPSWATHVGISVNMAGLGAGDVFFDDFEAAEF